MIGVSGSKGESVPKETMNPWLFFGLIHTTVVPALTQKNGLSFALAIAGFTRAESRDLVTLTVHVEVGEPQVLSGLQRLSGCGSSHAYLLFFCACKVVQPRRTQNNIRSVRKVLRCCWILIAKQPVKPNILNRFCELFECVDARSSPHFHSIMLASLHGFS